MIESINKATKVYSLLQKKVEESGEHILIGSGELYLDQVLHDVRLLFNKELELKISEPFISIAETVSS
jgi:U5 small nuclear ribonucleoprotein component